MAVDKAKSDILIFDDDDIPNGEYLERMTKALLTDNFEVISFQSVYENSDDFAEKINRTPENMYQCVSAETI